MDRAPMPPLHLKQTGPYLSFLYICSSHPAWHKSLNIARQVENPALFFLLIHNNSSFWIDINTYKLYINTFDTKSMIKNCVHSWVVRTLDRLSSLISKTLTYLYFSTTSRSKSLTLILLVFFVLFNTSFNQLVKVK